HDITPAMLLEAGVMRADEDGTPRRELFYNRVTFPIRDRRGRLVSFGGRILGDGQPKYLNGPETPIFSKRRVLFGLDRAREGVRGTGAGAELLVVEGYMDVIALHQAGFHGAVAPLGTALTAEQLEALWQVGPAPVLCFDGDAAGQRAAVKAAQTALPLLNVERTLRFCVLPEGEDPDSLVRRDGSAAMAALVEGARPMGQVLFGLLSEGVRNPGPEQRAALRRRLVEVAALIPDKALAAEYRSTLLDSFFETFRRGGGKGAARPAIATAPVAMVDADLQRQCILTAIILEQPVVMGEVQDAYCRLELPADIAALREELLDLYDAQGALPPAEDLAASLSATGLDDVCQRVRAVRGRRGRGRDEDDLFGTDPRREWWHFYALLNVGRFAAEIRGDTERMCAGELDEAAWLSLRTRLLALDALRRGGEDVDE
ncbi:DNA primase, partial [Komagataeibacter rhaeticus]